MQPTMKPEDASLVCVPVVSVARLNHVDTLGDPVTVTVKFRRFHCELSWMIMFCVVLLPLWLIGMVLDPEEPSDISEFTKFHVL